VDCSQAHDRIARVELAGWTGLPAGCPPSAFGLSGDPEEWAVRPLGDDFRPARFRLLELTGYYRPTVSVRDGAVVLFDGMNPQADLGALELGEPEERLDYAHGTLPVDAGEWVFAARGITLFVNTTADTLLHVALYAPTTAAGYRADLRPHLGKTLRPLRQRTE
jgi:hypothetical protein